MTSVTEAGGASTQARRGERGMRDGTPFASRTDALFDAVVRQDLYAVESMLKERFLAQSTCQEEMLMGPVVGAAFHLALSQGDIDTAKLLRRYGACLEVFDDLGRTPLHVAAAGNLPCLRYLLAAGADVSAAEAQSNRTVLHFMAASPETCEALGEVFSRGAALEAQDCDGLTPLFVAVQRTHVLGVRLLLDAGASVHALDDSGNNVLSWLHCLHLPEVRECASLLLEAGADPHARAGECGSFWDICEQWPEFRQKIAALDAQKAIDRIRRVRAPQSL